MNNCKQSDSMMHTPYTNCDIDNLPVAMAYVPWQTFDCVYEIDKALQCGTIFPELNKPWVGCGTGKRGGR